MNFPVNFTKNPITYHFEQHEIDQDLCFTINYTIDTQDNPNRKSLYVRFISDHVENSQSTILFRHIFVKQESSLEFCLGSYVPIKLLNDSAFTVEFSPEFFDKKPEDSSNEAVTISSIDLKQNEYRSLDLQWTPESYEENFEKNLQFHQWTISGGEWNNEKLLIKSKPLFCEIEY